MSKIDRLAMFLPDLSGGGAERVMVNLAIAFCERGIGVDLVLLKAEGAYLKELPSGARVVDLKASRMLTGFVALAQYMRRERPPIMLAALSHANVTALLAALLSRSKVPVVVCEQSNATMDLDNNPGIKPKVVKVLMRWLYPRAYNIIAVSEGVADDLANLLGMSANRISVVHNSVPIDEISNRSNLPVTHPWFVDKSTPVVLAVGRLRPQKDYETLLRAFSIAIKERDLRLVILGEGELRSSLEALIEELGLAQAVALPGFTDNPYAYMRQADLFVLASRWEGLPMVLVEAMACGVPVISTDSPSGPAEILENGKWGRLVPVGDMNALARAMLDTLDDAGPPTTERVMDFSIEKAADAYLSLLCQKDK
ncbi:MAG: glycosyltransferase [Pseudomonadales bacterium]